MRYAKKILTAFENINDISRLIIVIGCSLSALLFITAIGFALVNIKAFFLIFANDSVPIQLGQTAGLIFTQTICGAILFDYFHNTKDKTKK